MTEVEINRELIEQWLEALKSGNYKQVQGKLRTPEAERPGHCCLGVLADIVAPDNWVIDTAEGPFGEVLAWQDPVDRAENDIQEEPWTKFWEALSRWDGWNLDAMRSKWSEFTREREDGMTVEQVASYSTPLVPNMLAYANDKFNNVTNYQKPIALIEAGLS